MSKIVRPGRRLKHLTVHFGGKPCVLIKSPAICQDGILLPVENGEEPTRFNVDRSVERYPATYSRRRANYAIKRTLDLLDLRELTDMQHHEIARRLRAMSIAGGKWEIITTKWPSKAQLLAEAAKKVDADLAALFPSE